MTNMNQNDTETGKTLRFQSEVELACHLFDRAVGPDDTARDRLHMARLSAAFAHTMWRELQSDPTTRD